MNGAPANPINGTEWGSSATRLVTVSVWNHRSAGSRGRSRSRSAAEAKGCSQVGPTPGVMSIPKPAAHTGVTMSENRMAASTP